MYENEEKIWKRKVEKKRKGNEYSKYHIKWKNIYGQ